MKKKTTTILRTILAALLLASMAGCSADSDSPAPDSGDTGKVSIEIGIGIKSDNTNASTRADGDDYIPSDDDSAPSAIWNDRNATEGEMMRNSFAVAVQNGLIAGILVSKDYNKEQSYVGRTAMKLSTGQTSFYSFANIRPEQLGIDPDNCVGQAAPDFDHMTYKACGNVSNTTDFADGIPMSGKLEMEVTERTQVVDLEVTRLVAKAKIRLTNETATDITVKNITLSDITSNADGALYLIQQTGTDGNITPHIVPLASYANYTVSLGNEGQKVLAGGSVATDVTFYVNESEAHTPKYFVIDIETTQQTVAHRVALMKWNTIARNDYLVIPIRLNDYRITYDVEQFTAIGVLPTVQNDRDMLTVRFHSYGEFHMRPHVTRLSDGKELTPGTSSADGWTLADWSVLELQPEGGEGTCIYDRMPYADHTRRMFEGTMGNRKGYALHQVLFRVSGVGYAIPYKVQIISE